MYQIDIFWDQLPGRQVIKDLHTKTFVFLYH
jgi:hypothetical protein